MAGRGLYANIAAKKARIKAGSGEKMRKRGAKGSPTAANAGLHPQSAGCLVSTGSSSACQQHPARSQGFQYRPDTCRRQ